MSSQKGRSCEGQEKALEQESKGGTHPGQQKVLIERGAVKVAPGLGVDRLVEGAHSNLSPVLFPSISCPQPLHLHPRVKGTAKDFVGIIVLN